MTNTHPSITGRPWAFRRSSTSGRSLSVLLVLLLCLLGSPLQTQAQSCATSSPTLLKWDFNNLGSSSCNGASQFQNGESSYYNSALLNSGLYTYCPQVNNGCAQGLLGSKAFQNTYYFASTLCLQGFYACESTPCYGAPGWDPNDTQFHPEGDYNLYVTYKLPAGKSGCLSSFALKYLQMQYRASSTINFEKQGVGVYRNGVLIYSTTQPISLSNVNATPLTFTFPTSSDFCSDGSQAVEYKIVFGLVHRLIQVSSIDSGAKTGYDDLSVFGTCGSSPTPVAALTPPTCANSGANSDGRITLTNFGTTDKYDISPGSSYTGSATYATATAIPSGGVITTTLPNPATPQVYTVRVFSASCSTDLNVTLNPVVCPISCVAPSAIVSAIAATCSGQSANNNASLSVSSVTGGSRVGFSPGPSYTGPLYAAATPVVGGAVSFTGLVNALGTQPYTVRVFNDDGCFKDYTVNLAETDCGCKRIGVEIISADQYDPNSTPGNGISSENDFATYELCRDTKNVDLVLIKTVNTATGTTCPAPTAFTWTVTLQNTGTMTATGIQVADVLTNGMLLVSATPSSGTFTEAGGWQLSSLAAGASATLTLVTQATKAGSFTNCAQITGFSPQNDPTPNQAACAVVTVSGASTPEITKEFSPAGAKPNVPIRLTIKIINNEATPITLTAPLVDNLPGSPAQMTVYSTPNLVTNLTSVVAAANGTSITLPTGTVLLPGLNQIQLDVVAPVSGVYCNTIAAGALQTTSCGNLVSTQSCVDVQTTYVMAPLISKTMLPAVVQTGQNSLLTLTVENRNASPLTLLQDFVDYLPAGLVLAGTVTGSCPGVSTFSSTDRVGLVGGSVLAANSTCTITVPVKATTAGTYCNFISANSLIGTVSNGTVPVMTGNEDHAEACLTVTPTPCTALSGLSILASPAGVLTTGSPTTLTASGTGTGAFTIYSWRSSGGSFSNAGATPTVWTAPALSGVYTVTVVADNNATGYGSCTATAITSVTVAGLCSLTATATAGVCQSATNQYSVSGVISLSNTPGGTATVTDGVESITLTVAASATSVAYSLTGLSSGTGSHTVTVSLPGCGTASVPYTAPASCTVAPPRISVALSSAPICNSLTNQYTATGTVSLTNIGAGTTLTVTDNGLSLGTVSLTAGQPSASFSVSGVSNAASHTLIATLSGGTSASVTYSAPVACTVAPPRISVALSSAPICNSLTNQYTATASVSLTNIGAGTTLTMTDNGLSLGNLTLSAGQTTVSFSVSGVSNAASHTLIATLSGGTSASVTYSAPVACSVAPPRISVALSSAPICNSLTNTYTATASVSLTNIGAGTTLTMTDNGLSLGNLTLSAGQTTASFSVSGVSNAASHTLIATLSGGTSASVTYSAPASCTVAPPRISVALSSAPICNSLTNQYTATASVSLTNIGAGTTLTMTDNGLSLGTVSLSAGQTTASFSVSGVSNAASHTLIATLSGGTSASTVYSAPASCTVAPPRISVALSSAPICNSLTNQYTATASVSLTNIGAGTTLTMTDNGLSLGNLTLSAGQTTASFSVSGVSNAASHTLIATLSGGTSASTVYSAPASCTVAPPRISVALSSAPICNSLTNTYTATASVSLTNIGAGTTLTMTDNGLSLGNLTLSAGQTTASFSVSGVSNAASHTLIATLSGGTSASVTYSAPVACTVAPPRISVALSSAPICNSLTNQYTATASVSLTNIGAGTTLTMTDNGLSLGNLTLSAGQTTASFSVSGVSNAASHTLIATLSGGTSASVTYSAPVACTVAPPRISVALSSAPICNSLTNQYTATGTVSLTNIGAGTTLTMTDNGLSLGTVSLSTGQTTVSFSVSGVSNAASHTLIATLSGGISASVTYSAPVACTVAPPRIGVALSSAPICNSLTNQYTATASVSLTNIGAGTTLTMTDNGLSLGNLTLSAGQTTASFSVSGVSNAASHTLIATLSGSTSASTVYSAPASCTVAPPRISVALSSAPICNSLTNTYTATGTVSLTNIGAGTTLTMTDNGLSLGNLTLSAGQTTASFSVSGVSNAASHTLIATLSGGTSASVTYSAPVACTVAPPRISVALSSAPICNSLTNQYTATASVSLTNIGAGTTLTMTDNGLSLGTVSLSAGQTTASFSVSGVSNAASHTLIATLSGGTSASVTYSAPVACTVAPPRISVALSSAPICNSLTNTYTATASVSLTNIGAGTTLTMTDNGLSLGNLTLSAGQTTASFSVSGVSNAASHTLIATLSGGTSASTVYSAPASCTVCSLRLTIAKLPAGQVGTAYSQTLTTTGGIAPLTYALLGTLPAGLSLNTGTGTISGTPSAVGSYTVSLQVTDSRGCSVSLPFTIIDINFGTTCALLVSLSAGPCSTPTNTYTLQGVLSLSNTVTGGIVTIRDGVSRITLTVSNTATALAFSLPGLVSDGSVHLVETTLDGCPTSTTPYTAPQSCTVSCQPPIHVCKDANYAFLLTAPDGQASYQWYRNGNAIPGATLSSYTATQAGSYSVIANGSSVNLCPTGSCCPLVIVEDSIARFQAFAQTPGCSSAMSVNADGRIVVTNWKLSAGDTTPYVYQVSLGSSFNAAQVVAGSPASPVPGSGVLVGNLPNPATGSGQSYTVRISNDLGCYRDVVVTLGQTTCACPPAQCVPVVIRKIRSR